MDESRARELLGVLASAAPDSVVLWRGPELGGSDVDVVVAPGREHEVARVLRDAGLSPALQDDGRILWRSLDAGEVIVDAMPARGWPAWHPSLERVIARATRATAGLPVAAVEDRLLIRAAEAVAGQPIDHIVGKARPLLASPGARERLDAVARAESELPLAALIADLDGLERAAARGTLSYRRALSLATRSSCARAALRARIALQLGFQRRLAPPPATGAAGPGVVVALSGMDGAGKSTAALEIAARLEARGRPTVISWSRLAADNDLLDRIAGPVRRILRRRPAAADPAPPSEPGGDDQPARRGDVIERVWVAVVAAVNARACRRAARARRSGLVVICDRWLADAMVDIEVRYGRHRGAEWVLRHSVPHPDASVLLEIDTATSARRKPGDQSERALATMARRYASVADELGFPPAGAPARDGRLRVDATGDRAQVVDAIDAHLATVVGGSSPAAAAR